MPLSEEDIVRQLTERFDAVTVTVQRARRIWLEAPREGFLDVLRYLSEELGFFYLSTVTGMDMGEDFQLIYHLSHENGILLNAKVNAPHSDPTFETTTDIFKGGALYEIEVRNLLGLNFKGLPEHISYPLPDNWPKGQYPLRKGWVKPSPDADKNTGEGEGGTSCCGTCGGGTAGGMTGGGAGATGGAANPGVANPGAASSGTANPGAPKAKEGN